MSRLIIILPLSAALTAAYAYAAVGAEGQTIDHQGCTTAPLLPATARANGEVIAIVPAQALSWHYIELPKGTSQGSPRLRAVLEGILEERLLDAPEQLHFALEPNAKAGNAVWVAVCDKNWLQQHLQNLETSGCTVSRIVPECQPNLRNPPQLHIIGDAQNPQVILSGLSHESGLAGVTMWPLAMLESLLAPWLKSQGADANWHSALELRSEPAVVAQIEAIVGSTVSLQNATERSLAAAQTGWDLAQFDLANTGHRRMAKNAITWLQNGLNAPEWRMARWGLIGLIICSLIGVNALAWKEKSSLQAKEASIRSLLTQNFPGVKVIVNPPLQMEREISVLRQATGAYSDSQLESILGAVGALLPEGKQVSQIQYLDGELNLKGLELSPEQITQLRSQLEHQGYAVQSSNAMHLSVRKKALP